MQTKTYSISAPYQVFEWAHAYPSLNIAMIWITITKITSRMTFRSDLFTWYNQTNYFCYRTFFLLIAKQLINAHNTPCFRRSESWQKVSDFNTRFFLKLFKSSTNANFAGVIYSKSRFKKESNTGLGQENITFLVWPNGWVFVYELSGFGFESSCSHINFADNFFL